MDETLFRIGEMAKLFHLSVSTIRHYEALGLLRPERVDPATGYRYYGPRQFDRFNTIRYLRALGMPLDDIADFLRNRDVEKIEEKLRAQKAAVAEKQRELERIQRKIDHRLDQLVLPPAPGVRIRYRGSHTAAEQRYRTLLAHLRERGWEPAGFSREITVIDFGITSDPEKFVTEISIPVRSSDGSVPQISGGKTF